AGIADHVDDTNGIVALELIFQNGEFAVASNVGSQPAGNRGVEPRRVVPNRNQAIDRLQLALALQAKQPGRLGLDHALHLSEQRLAHDDGAGSGLVLQPRRQIYDVAMGRDAGALAAIDGAEHHRPGGEADPQSRAHAEFSLDAVAGGGEPLLDLERGTAGAQRPVLERGWRAEQGQDAVAGEVLDGPAMMMDRRRGQAGDVTDQREGSLLTCPLDEGGEVDQVGHQNGYLAVFALVTPLQQSNPGRPGHLTLLLQRTFDRQQPTLYTKHFPHHTCSGSTGVTEFAAASRHFPLSCKSM